MAGEWIKMRLDLATDPAVISMALLLGIEEDAVVGKLHRLWSWASCQTTDGNAHGVTDSWVDRYLGVSGFASAMVRAGWLIVTESGISFPKWDAHNSQSAKRRLLAAKRVALHKERKGNAASVSETLPREEEEKNKKKKKETPLPPIPESIDSPEFREAWASWIAHRKEKREPIRFTSATRQLKQLAAMGPARAIACIEHTIFKGWTGLREPEPDRNGYHALPDLKARIAQMFPEEGES